MKLGLKTKVLLLASGPLIILTLILGIITVQTLKHKIVGTAQEKLMSDLAMAGALLEEKYPGEWSLREGFLFKGDVKMNENFSTIDRIGALTGDTVTIFQGDTRIATNVKNESGVRAVGTKAADNVIQTTLREGKTYLGKANVVGTINQTVYVPIKNAKGEQIGMLYVGVPNTKFDKVTKEIADIVLLIGLFGILGSLTVGFFVTRSIVRPVYGIIDGLTKGSGKVASVSQEILSYSQSLAEGASNQAGSIEETSASIEQMSSMTKQNADNANQANSLMMETSKVVNEANQSMKDLTQAMNEISIASEETGKIIKTIDEISFQTNLLALNAAVEAARAGEAGAGFAVVADEVRNLALRAAEAAKNTSQLIDGTVRKIKTGSDIVDRTNEAFAKAAVSSRKVGDLISEITAASQEQAQGIEQINRAVVEMDKVVQKNAANAEESASASEQMQAQSKQMHGFVGELIAVVGRKDNGQGAGSVRALGHTKNISNQKPALNYLSNAGFRTNHPIRKNGNGKYSTDLKAREIRPDRVMPLADDDFKDF